MTTQEVKTMLHELVDQYVQNMLVEENEELIANTNREMRVGDFVTYLLYYEV
jgi:hypothetical protein